MVHINLSSTPCDSCLRNQCERRAIVVHAVGVGSNTIMRHLSILGMDVIVDLSIINCKEAILCSEQETK